MTGAPSRVALRSERGLVPPVADHGEEVVEVAVAQVHQRRTVRVESLLVKLSCDAHAQHVRQPLLEGSQQLGVLRVIKLAPYLEPHPRVLLF